MDVLEHLDQMRDLALNAELLLIIDELTLPDVDERLLRPLGKPINGGAVDE